MPSVNVSVSAATDKARGASTCLRAFLHFLHGLLRGIGKKGVIYCNLHVSRLPVNKSLLIDATLC